MRSYRKVDESYEFKIEPGKLILLGVGSGLTLLLVFLVGVLVGKSLWAERGRQGVAQELGVPQTQPPAETPKLGFYDGLREPDGTVPAMEPAAPLPPEPAGETTVGAAAPPPATAGAPAPSPTSSPAKVSTAPRPAVSAAAEAPRPVAAKEATEARPAAAEKAAPPPAPAKAAEPSPPKPAGVLPTPRFTVQVGSYRDRASADDQAKKIRGRNVPAQVVAVPVEGRTWYRVQVSSFETRAEAEAYYRKRLLPQNVQGFVTNR